jgi:feruloyl esterase
LKWVDRIQQLAHWTEATSTDLGRFASRGGKLLLTHGAADDSISPHNTIAYWHRLVAALGASTVEGFARFYLVPGQGHGGGMFASRHNWLDTLEQWVEHDQAPAQLVASDGNTQPGTAATNGRTRPLCRYGSYPHYIGPAQPSQAQANDAAHFSCVPD